MKAAGAKSAESPRFLDAESLKLSILAFFVFLPMTGTLLNGYELSFRIALPFGLAALTLALRLAYRALLAGNARWKPMEAVQAKAGGLSKYLPPLSARQQAWLFFVILAALPFLSNKYWLSVAILCLIYVLLGLGLNIVVGLAGLLDLGFIAFYAVGAYGFALGAEYLGLGFWTALPLAALLAGCFGVLLAFPVLRMHGDYLAIVTLGFGEIIRLVLNNWVDFTGGPNGVSAPAPTFFGLEFTRRAKLDGTPYHEFFGVEYASEAQYIFIYLVALLAALLLIHTIGRLKRMPIGRAWEALREDEIASRALGVNHVTTKLSAFSMGAACGGIAGVIFAAFQGFINPSSFSFFESALVLAIVVLGGMGSTLGVVVAALVLTGMPEILREFAEYRVLVFGALMVVIMIWRPRGLVKTARPSFELANMRKTESGKVGA